MSKANGGWRRTASRGATTVPGEPASLDQTVYDGIFDAVMERRLAPGTKLVEATLCEDFGVSRTVVRQALQRLAQAQVVDLTPNRGASVAAPSPEETREVFAARRAIEAAILPLAMAHATRREVEGLRRRVAAEEQALQSGDLARWVRLAGDFHLAIAALSRNRVLQRFLTELMSRCSLIVALYETPGHPDCEHEEHVDLVERFALGDVAAATALMMRHLEALEARLQIPGDPQARQPARA